MFPFPIHFTPEYLSPLDVYFKVTCPLLKYIVSQWCREGTVYSGVTCPGCSLLRVECLGGGTAYSRVSNPLVWNSFQHNRLELFFFTNVDMSAPVMWYHGHNPCRRSCPLLANNTCSKHSRHSIAYVHFGTTLSLKLVISSTASPVLSILHEPA